MTRWIQLKFPNKNSLRSLPKTVSHRETMQSRSSYRQTFSSAMMMTNHKNVSVQFSQEAFSKMRVQSSSTKRLMIIKMSPHMSSLHQSQLKRRSLNSQMEDGSALDALTTTLSSDRNASGAKSLKVLRISRANQSIWIWELMRKKFSSLERRKRKRSVSLSQRL